MSNESDNDAEMAATITNSNEEIDRLYKHFKNVIHMNFRGKYSTKTCAMECGRPKATKLLPCKHQPTCDECFVLWKCYLIREKKTVICPFCKREIEKHIVRRQPK